MNLPQLHFKKVAILGVGLLGGSLGLEIKKNRLASQVVGYGRHRKNLVEAKKRKQIDVIASSLEAAIEGADLVLLCSPVESVKEHLKLIAKKGAAGCFVMDVGSTKKEIMQVAAKVLPQKIYFVGAHPMAGSEKQGASAAQLGLFAQKSCLLSFQNKTSAKIKKTATKFWQKLGSKVIVVDAGQHDQTLAFTSHLPQMVAYLLMATVAKNIKLPELKSFSGNGLKDTTRLAASAATMWMDILKTNQSALLKALNALRFNLDWLIDKLESRQWISIEKFFKSTAQLRKKI